MKHILIGYMRDGRGGVDHYIKRFVTELLEMDADCLIDIVSSFDVDTLNSIFSDTDNVNVLRVHSLKSPLKQYKDMIKIFSDKKYDIAYFNISEATNGVGILAAYKNKVPRVIVHSHSAGIDVANGLTRGVRKFVHIISKRLFIGYADEYVACSDKAAEWMFPKKICDKKEYTSVFNEVDMEKFAFDSAIREEYRNKLGVQDKLVIGAVGGFSYPKNNMFFVDIVSELVKRNDNICFLAIGEGNLLEQVRAYAKSKGVADKMLFMGQRNDVPELMMAMDIFVMPSRFEGLPYAAVEAQVSGLKCILSSNISKDTKISDGCIFIDGYNPKDWAHIIDDNVVYEREVLCDSDYMDGASRLNIDFIDSFIGV